LLTPAVSILFFLQCSSTDKVTYNIPAELSEENKKKLVDILAKGKALFKANCAECHGVFTAGKDSIPNFTNTQIDNYSARFLGRDPKNHAVINKMSTEQLNQTLAFLRYKNPENIKGASVKMKK